MLNIFFVLGRGGGHMVSVLAFYPVDQSSNPAESTVFIMSSCLKINEKEAGIGHLIFFLWKGFENEKFEISAGNCRSTFYWTHPDCEEVGLLMLLNVRLPTYLQTI